MTNFYKQENKCHTNNVRDRIKSVKWQWAEHIARRQDGKWTIEIIKLLSRDHKEHRGSLFDEWDCDMWKAAGNHRYRFVQNRREWEEEYMHVQYLL